MTPNLGTITACYTVTMRRKSRHSAERIWRAITTPEEVEKWMGYHARIDLRVGGEWHIDFSSTGGGELPAVFVRVEQPSILAYVWALSVMQWELKVDGDGCAYTFTQSGLADRGEAEEDLAAGWHEFLDRLDDHLEGRYLGEEERVASWEALKPGYREQLDRLFTSRPGTSPA